ncbi:MAG: hypothetical protein K0R57_2433 [Paenibacillaceae bacterium]|nr:hypothetical protein [Paenibacillaceae bacterium]
MNCSTHLSHESSRFCHHCNRYVCPQCIESGYCRSCNHLLDKHTPVTKAVSVIPPAVFAVLWAGYFYYGLTAGHSNAKYVWPYYFALLGGFFLTCSILAHFITSTYKRQKKMRWVPLTLLCLMLMILLYLTPDVIPLVNYIDAVTE